MAYKNPLTACGGYLKIDEVPILHVTNVEIKKSGTNPKFISSDSDGKRLAVAGCPENEVTCTYLTASNAAAAIVTRGTIYTITAVASATFEVITGDFLAAEVVTSEPINEGDFVSETVTFYEAKKET